MSDEKLTRSQQKRLAIQEAALCLFRKCGVKNTSMDKIAQVAQVSKRTVYNHFETKEALVMHLVSQLRTEATVNTSHNYCPDTPLAQQLEALLSTETKVMACENYIDLVRVAFGYFLFEPGALEKEMQKMQHVESDLERWLKAASHDKRLKQLDIEIAISQLHSLLKGSCFWPQLMRIAKPLSNSEQLQLVKRSVEMFLNQYTAEK